MHVDQEMFALLIVQECIRVLEDLKGYSGVGSDGNPYDTPSWNAALKAAEEVIIKRMHSAYKRIVGLKHAKFL